MRIDSPMRLVRELKGAPLSIYIILGLVGQPVTQEYLERAYGYSDVIAVQEVTDDEEAQP